MAGPTPLPGYKPEIPDEGYFAFEYTVEEHKELQKRNNPLKQINRPVVDIAGQTKRQVFVARGNEIEWKQSIVSVRFRMNDREGGRSFQLRESE